MASPNGAQCLFRYYGNVLSLQQAGENTDGYLSAADWNRFSNVADRYVASFNNRYGTVIPMAGDYTAAMVGAEVPLTFEASLYRNGDAVSLLNDMAPDAPAPGTNMYYGMTGAGVRGWFSLGVSGVASWNTRTGAVMPQAGDYTAADVGAEVPLTFAASVFRNGNEITLLNDMAPDAPVTNQMYYGMTATGVRGWFLLPAAGVTSVFTRTGAVTAQVGDYAAFYQPLNSNLTAWAAKTPYDGNVQVSAGKLLSAFNTLSFGGIDNSTISFGGGGSVAYTNVANTFLHGQTIKSLAAGEKALVVQGAAGQTANIQEWQDTTSAVLASISAAGVFTGSGAGLTALPWASITGAPAFEPALGNPSTNGYILSSTAAGVRSWIAPTTAPVSSVFGRTGAITAAVGDYSAFYQPLNTNLTTWAAKTPYAGNVVVASGQTLTINQTMTLGGVAGSSLNIGNGGALGSAAFTPSTNYAVAAAAVPVGGTAGQVLTKNSTTNYDAGWAASAGLPAGGTVGQVLTKNSATNYDASWAAPPGGGGGGTVMSFSAGNLPPLFTTAVATASSTPALSFVLSNAAAHTFLGNNTGATAVPAYVQPAFTDLAGVATTAQLPATVVYTSGSYADPAWITALAWSKLTGVPSFEVPLTFIDSVTRSGNTISLVGDAASASVGNSQYYGTNASGARGFWNLPSAPANIVTGTGIANQLALFSGTSVIGSSANLTFDPVNGLLTITNNASYGSTGLKFVNSGGGTPMVLSATASGRFFFTDNAGNPAFFGAAGFRNVNDASYLNALNPAGWQFTSLLHLDGGFTVPSAALGDLMAANSTGLFGRVGVGSDGQVLSADSTQANGIRWIAPPAAAVTTVFGRTGAITAAAGDYAAFYEVPLTFQMSLTRSGNFVNLVGDSAPASVGSSSYYGTNSAGTRGFYPLPTFSAPVSSVFTRTGAITAQAGDYSAFYPSLAGAYADPAWITSLAWSKISGAPATGVSTVFGRGGAVTAAAADYGSFYVSLTGTYSNPAWITGLAWGKITGAPAFITQANAEPPLGNPATDGQVLSSTAAGVRSWITPSGGGTVNVSGTPTAGQIAGWVDASTIQGIAVTGTGSVVLSANPTFTGTLNCANLNVTGTMLRPNAIQGVNDGSDATAGNVGQLLNSVRTTAASSSNGAAYAVAQVTLTAGDWDLRGNCECNVSATAWGASGWVAAANISVGSNAVNSDGYRAVAGGTITGPVSLALPPRRVSITANTVVYLSALWSAVGATSPAGNWIGFLEARRVR